MNNSSSSLASGAGRPSELLKAAWDALSNAEQEVFGDHLTYATMAPFLLTLVEAHAAPPEVPELSSSTPSEAGLRALEALRDKWRTEAEERRGRGEKRFGNGGMFTAMGAFDECADDLDTLLAALRVPHEERK